MHRPKISVKKKKELKRIVNEVEKSGMSRGLEINRHQSMEIFRKEQEKTQKPKYENYLHEVRHNKSHSVMKSNKHKWNNENSMIPKPKLKRKGYMVDYLLKKRIKREQMESEDPNYRNNKKIDWDRLAGSPKIHTRSYSNAYEDE